MDSKGGEQVGVIDLCTRKSPGLPAGMATWFSYREGSGDVR